MGRLVYEQPGTRVDGSCHSKEGSKYVKGNRKGSKGESTKESKKQGEAPYIYCKPECVHSDCV
jgi:hypothetical protein